MTNRVFTPKDDTRENVEVPENVIKAQNEKMKRLKPLRINDRTVIYVTEDKCNETYRQDYLKRIGKIKKEIDAAHCCLSSSEKISKEDRSDNVVELHKQGMGIKHIAAALHVSISTCCKYINRYKNSL